MKFVITIFVKIIFYNEPYCNFKSTLNKKNKCLWSKFVDEILDHVGFKKLTRKLLKRKLSHESLPTAWELIVLKMNFSKSKKVVKIFSDGRMITTCESIRIMSERSLYQFSILFRLGKHPENRIHFKRLELKQKITLKTSWQIFVSAFPPHFIITPKSQGKNFHKLRPPIFY